MSECPHCHASGSRVVRDWRNALRIVASLVLVPFYFLGGMAGDTRGPFLPLERRCPACGHRFKGRSVIDEIRGSRRRAS